MAHTYALARMMKVHFVLLAGLATACGVKTRALRPVEGVDVAWRSSFVILIGVDSDAPKRAPSGCRKLGDADVEAPNLKVSVSDEFRRAARRLGGNAVSGIERTGGSPDRPVIYRGTVLHCPWFKKPTPSSPSELVRSQHGRSSCSSSTLANLTPPLGTVARRSAGTTPIEIEAVNALALACARRSPAQCFDDAVAMSPPVEDRQRPVVRYRAVLRGHSIRLKLDATEVHKLYATTADMVDDLRRLESKHQTVRVQSVGRAVDYDWSTVDVLVKGPKQRRDVAASDLEWTLPSTSLRRLVESVHIWLDALARADVIVENQATLLEELGKRLAAAQPEEPVKKEDLALIGSISFNYAAIDDTTVEPPFHVTLRTRCRADYED